MASDPVFPDRVRSTYTGEFLVSRQRVQDCCRFLGRFVVQDRTVQDQHFIAIPVDRKWNNTGWFGTLDTQDTITNKCHLMVLLKNGEGTESIFSFISYGIFGFGGGMVNKLRHFCISIIGRVLIYVMC